MNFGGVVEHSLMSGNSKENGIKHTCEVENMESERSSSPEYQELMEYMNSLPAALRPVYTTEQPNQPIVLYGGALEIAQEINHHPVQIQGHGKVEYVWFPHPCIKFEFFTNENILFRNNLSASLTLLEIVVSVDVFMGSINVSGSNGNYISGRIKQAVVQGKDQDLTYVLFHVVNFHDFVGNQQTLLKKDSGGLQSRSNRVSFEVESWKITLDQLETITDNVKSLNSQGGFAITHVGKLEKLDGQSFSGDEAKDLLDIFANFLSFARGFKVPLILLAGYDSEKNQIWQHWYSSGGHSWKYVDSWFPTNNAGIIAEIFPSFLRSWQEWIELEKLAFYNYLEANAMSTLEVKIVLAQIALELIAHKEGQNKDNASEKLRGLFRKYKIPVKIPFDRLSKKTSTFTDLTDAFRPQSPPFMENLIRLKKKLKQELEEKLERETNEKEKRKIRKTLNQIDAPYLFTTVRNDIVHSKKKIENLTDYLYESSDIGLWYLELVMLAIFNYRGCYSNRLLKYRQNGETETVPWASS